MQLRVPWLLLLAYATAMALYHPLLLQVAVLVASNSLVASTRNENSFQFALVVSESEDANSFYGGGSINESLSAVDLALQHVSTCPDIPWHANLVHMFPKVSPVTMLHMYVIHKDC